MIARCEDRNQPGYPDYGGRGIQVCKRWRESFEAFLVDMGEPPPGQSLDRIDVNGHYEPENCRWATIAQQNTNRRHSMWVETESGCVPLKVYAEQRGLLYVSLWQRMRRFSESAEQAAHALLTGPRAKPAAPPEA